MNKDELFYQDILSQQFSVGTFYVATRYILLYGLISKGRLLNVYSKSDLVEYLFRAYCYNKDIAIHHPNIAIRDVPYCGINVFYNELELALDDWVKDAKNSILSYDMKSVYLDLDNSANIVENIRKMLTVLFFKNFKTNFNIQFTIEDSVLLDDLNLETFGKSSYRDLVFGDMQYCVVCDEYNAKDLYAVHIVQSNKTNSIAILSDPNNGLIMCKCHAQLYNDGKFSFDTRGRIIGKLTSDYCKARVSNKIYIKRKKYFELLNDIK